MQHELHLHDVTLGNVDMLIAAIDERTAAVAALVREGIQDPTGMSVKTHDGISLKLAGPENMVSKILSREVA